MYPYYKMMADNKELTYDETLANKMKAENEKKLKELDDKIKDAQENLGENEVREAHLAKATYYKEIGDKVWIAFDWNLILKENAIKQYTFTSTKTVALGQRLDIVFSILIIGLAWLDMDLLKRNIEKAELYVIN